MSTTIRAFIFLLLVLLFFGVYVNAQILKGYVQDGISGKPIPAVVVTNLNTGKITYTALDGSFTIAGTKGMQVSFAASGYRIQQKIIPTSLGGVAEMVIDLFPMSYELQEFEFRSKYTPYQLDSIERQQTYASVLARQKTGNILSPITLLAEKISRKSRRTFAFQKNFHDWENEKFISSRYTIALTQSLTGLTGDTLSYFMNINPMPYDFARAASDLELKMWIREKYKAWKNNPVYPPLVNLSDSLEIRGDYPSK